MAKLSPAILECEAVIADTLCQVPNDKTYKVHLVLTGRDYHLLCKDVIGNQRKKDGYRSRAAKHHPRASEDDARDYALSRYPKWKILNPDTTEKPTPKIGSIAKAAFEEDSPPKKRSPPIRIIRKDSD